MDQKIHERQTFNRLFRPLLLAWIGLCLVFANPLEAFAQTQTPTDPAKSNPNLTPSTESSGMPQPSSSPTSPVEKQVALQEIDFRDFPVVRGTFQLRCPTCVPAAPLSTNQLKVVENKMEIQASDLQAEYTGVHLILAINPTANWLSHNNKWVSALDYTAQALKKLVNRAETNGSDLFEFYSNPGIKKTGMVDGVALMDLLNAYIKSARPLESSQASFEAALSALEADSSGREKILIYASPIPAYLYLADFQAMLKRAQAGRIRVYFWMNDPFDMQQTQTGKDSLEEVRKTGGDVTAFKYEMTVLPNPLEILKGAGYTYKFKYLSFLRASDKPTISLSVNRPGEQPLLSNSLQGELQLLPPRISFIAPPEILHFSLNPDGKSHEPQSLPLNISIEFPDGHPRNLKSATLYLDGSVVQQNEHPPFGNFEVELAPYLSRKSLQFKAKLEDELSLSAETPNLSITLEMPSKETQAEKAAWQSPIVYGAAGLLALLAGGFFALTRRRKRSAEPQNEPAETGEVKPKEESSPMKRLSNLLPEKEKAAETYEIRPILASLNRLDNENMPAAEKPALIFNAKTLIGRNKERCDIVFEDLSVDEVHAELLIAEDGSATLQDLHSAAGTWADFKVLEPGPVRLHHREILQFGNIRVRYNSRDRVIPSKPVKAEDAPS
ncbi:MAG: FHA domain-containing protein [Anaerolineaceae bacterium]|nr:FHA domain-containing protein [Anaerolineaceae bacterium]